MPFPDDPDYVLQVGFEEEVAAVDQLDARVGDVSPEGFGAGGRVDAERNSPPVVDPVQLPISALSEAG